MVRDRRNFLSLWAIFCPFTPLTAPKPKILKNWKKYLEISSFYIWVPKIMIRWCTVPETRCVTDGRRDGRTNGRTDGWKKWQIEVGAWPKNLTYCLNANKISLNVKKTELLIFKHQRKKLDTPIKVKLSRKRLYPSKSFKYFGIKIDEKLN